MFQNLCASLCLGDFVVNFFTTEARRHKVGKMYLLSPKDSPDSFGEKSQAVGR